MVAKRTDGFRAEAKGKTLNLYIYDVIAWYGVTAREVAKALDDAKSVTTINVYVNSPGGSIFEGFAIYNQLVRHKAKVVMHVDGLAASAASFVVMAGDDIHMAANAYMMIHNPVVMVYGESADLRKYADLLDKLQGTIVSIYAARSGQSEEQLAEWMDEETWFTAEEAKEHGLADSVIAAKEATNDFDLSVFDNTPAVLLPQVQIQPSSCRSHSRQAIESIVAGFPEVFGSVSSDVAREPEGNEHHPDKKESDMAGKAAITEADVESRLAEARNKWTEEARAAQETALTEARNKWVEEAKASQEKAVTEAVDKASKETTTAVRDGIKDVLARCETAGISLTDARDMIERNLSLEDAKDEVIKNLTARNKPVGDGGGSDPGEKKDPTAKYRAEFKAAGGESEVGVSEEDFIASRVRDDAGGEIT